ncbi:unnamed protein product [Calypogeia fissa]
MHRVIRLWVRNVSFCIILAFLLTQIAAKSSSPCPLLHTSDEFTPTHCSSSSISFKASGRTIEGVLHQRKSLLVRVGYSFSDRVFQLGDGGEEEEQQNWPKLKFGWRTVSAVILGAVGAALSSAGGLGGGGLFVPLFNLLLQFDAKTSAALSNFMILGGSVANLYINLQQRHPILRQNPLIDFDVVLLLQPNMLLGISTGVMLNVILPDWVITALLAITLGYMTIHSFKGGLRRWKKESSQNRQQKISAENNVTLAYVTAPDFHHHHSSADISSSSDEDIAPASTDPLNIGAHNLAHNSADEDAEESLKSSKTRRSRGRLKKKLSDMVSEEMQNQEGEESYKDCSSFPVDKVVALAFTWLAFFIIQVLRGSKENQSILGIQACGFGYWILTLSQIPLAFGITAWTMKRLRENHGSRLSSEFTQEDGFVLTPESCMLLAWMALLAGLLGGLLGVGGGMIINPLLLTVGMIPQVTAGTCASMVFFSSSMSVVQFWLMGRVPLDYALSAAVLCAISSSAGVTLVHRAIDKFNRASIIVFSVTTVMGVSSVLMAGFGGYSVWQKYKSGAYMGFYNFC